jgi:hypothetical protein
MADIASNKPKLERLIKIMVATSHQIKQSWEDVQQTLGEMNK